MKYNCEYCSQSFEPMRSTAKFCSTKCRVNFNREMKRVNAILNSEARKGDKLAMLMDESDKISKEMHQYLTDIRLGKNLKNAWFAIDDLRARDRVLIRKIAALLTE